MRIDDSVLLRWQHLDAASVVVAFADFAKADRTFKPTKNPATSRWYVTVNGHEFELLLTGPKFWDFRARTGGGGAVDLVMHLGAVDFKRAARWLQERRL